MKKILSVIISSILILLPFGFCPKVLAEENSANFAVASDIHYNLPEGSLSGEIDDPIYWYANRRAAMENESGLILDAFLEQCAADNECEFVLISGDLADNGRSVPEEHIAVAQKLQRFEEISGKQVYVIDGNHDLGAGAKTDIEQFKTIYREFGYAEALETDPATCSYTADLNDKYRLIALDSCDPSKSTEDGMDLSRVNWVLRQADKAYADGKYPILMMHHNLLDHLPVQRITSHNFIVKFHFSTASLFADAGIRLVLTGHEHCSDATSFTSPAGNKIYDFATTSLTMYPLQYRYFTLSDSDISYKSLTVDRIDTDALKLQTNGYTDEQTRLMDDGLNAYAKGFLKAGVKYRLQLSLSKEKLGLSDGIPGDSIMRLVNKLTDIAEMPLYGDNSVETLASLYGISMPASNYQNLWDLATELVSMHYAGEEALKPTSDDVQILFKSVAVVVRSVFSAKDASALTIAAADLLNNAQASDISGIKTLCMQTFGQVTPFEYFSAALLSPFLYEFAYDSDGVNDNAGSMPGYGNTATRYANSIENFRAVLRKILIYIRLFFEMLTIR